MRGYRCARRRIMKFTKVRAGDLMTHDVIMHNGRLWRVTAVVEHAMGRSLHVFLRRDIAEALADVWYEPRDLLLRVEE
jgi:hypothetical protein